MIKIISFDIGGTLLFNEDEDNRNYNLAALALVVGLPYEVTRDAYKKIYQKTNGTFDELLNLFCQELQIEATSDLRDFFKHKFTSSKASISKKDLKLIKRLKELGYKIIFFSNSCALIDNDFDDEVLELVDHIYYSYNLGYTKSDSEAYRIIENDMGASSKEFLHIGDTLNSDYTKPIKNGWNAIYFGKCEDKEVVSITDLEEIENLLNNM